MLIAASTANNIIILKPLLIQALIICEEIMVVMEPNVLMKPTAINLTCVGYS